jgi:4-amino-4-deoxy-L-arabinose transferase-like glycosyltransferase
MLMTHVAPHPTRPSSVSKRSRRLASTLQTFRGQLHSPHVFLAAVVLLALLLRAVVVALVFRSVSANTFDHNEFGWEMGWTARSLALGRGFSSPFLPITGPTAIVPPLYPFLLAGVFKLFGVYSAASAIAILSFNSLCSALTCIPIYLALRSAVSTRLARLAALSWAIYPFSIYFAADRVWDYALTALLFTTCFWAAQRLHRHGLIAWIGFGLLVGITGLSNPSVLSLVPFLVLIELIHIRRNVRYWFRSALIRTVVLILACSAVWAPWALRNHRVLHSDALIRNGFWLEFYAGNSGDTSDSNSPAAHPASNPAEMQQYQASGEIAYMAQKKILALALVHRHPAAFVEVTVRRIIRFWTGFWSFSSAYLHREPLDAPNVLFCSTLTFFLLFGLRRWWHRDRAAALPYALAVLLFPIPYYLTHSSMDYRQPIEPLILSLVVIGVTGLRERSRIAVLTPHEIHPAVAVPEPSTIAA